MTKKKLVGPEKPAEPLEFLSEGTELLKVSDGVTTFAHLRSLAEKLAARAGCELDAVTVCPDVGDTDFEHLPPRHELAIYLEADVKPRRNPSYEEEMVAWRRSLKEWKRSCDEAELAALRARAELINEEIEALEKKMLVDRAKGTR